MDVVHMLSVAGYAWNFDCAQPPLGAHMQNMKHNPAKVIQKISFTCLLRIYPQSLPNFSFSSVNPTIHFVIFFQQP